MRHIFSAIILLSPCKAVAEVPDAFREYVTYGNFNQVYNSFHRVALVMSDSGIGNYLFIAFLAGMFYWAAYSAFRFVTGSRVDGTATQGVLFVLLGSLIYFALVRPTSSVAIYDEVSNRHVIVSDVPDGVALIAGIQNLIVNSIVDIIWTSSDPLSYRQNAGGDIFSILQSVFDTKPFIPSVDDSSGDNLNKSIGVFWADCSSYAVNSAGGGFDINNLNSGMSVTEMLHSLQSNTQFTTYYDTTNSAGVAMTCSEAMAEIEDDLSGLTDGHTGEKFWRERCGDAGFYDQTGSLGDSAFEVCRQKVVDFMLLEASDTTGIGIVREVVVANALFNYIKDYKIQDLSNFKINTALRGEGATATTWLPVVKGSIFAIYLGLVPWLLILLPTTLFPKVMQFIVGIFVFMTSWEIADSIIHSYAMDQSMAIIDDVLNDKLSLYDVWMMKGESFQALLLFGKMRWTSMLLAAILSAVVARYGGVAMAHFAGQMNFAGLGAQGSREILDPDTRSRDLRVLPTAAPAEALSNEYGFQGMLETSFLNQRTGLETSKKVMESTGGGAYEASNVQSDISHDSFVKSRADYNARTNIAENTGISREQQSEMISQDQEIKSLSAGMATTMLENPGDAIHLYTTEGASRIASDIKEQYAFDIMNTGGPSSDTIAMQNDFISGINGKSSREALVAYSAAANPTNITMTTDQKANYVDWHNRTTGEGITTDDIANSGSFTFGLDADNNLVPRFVNTHEGHTSAVYANTIENVGSDYNASIADDLANNNFVNSNVDVLGHKDVVVAQFTRAVGTYYGENQYANVGLSGSVSGAAGIGNGRLGGSVGAGGSITNTNAINEDIIATEIKAKIEAVTSNVEARQIIQTEYNNIIGYTENNMNVPSVRDFGEKWDSLTETNHETIPSEQAIKERH